jgi:hypothetical protein
MIASRFDNLMNSCLSILQRHRVRILTGTVIDRGVKDDTCSGGNRF